MTSLIEYKTINIPAAYETRESGLFKKKHEPDFQAALPQRLAATIDSALNEYGSAGWELVSIQPVWQSILQPSYGQNQMQGAGYVIPVSYLLAMKRLISPP